MSDTPVKTNEEAAKAAADKPMEMSISYKGPDFKTLAIGGGLIAGAASMVRQAVTATPEMLGNMVPAAPAVAPDVAASVASSMVV